MSENMKKTIDMKSFFQEFEEMKRQKRDAVENQMEDFKKKLQDAEVESFTVLYSGSGDSGEIYDTIAEPSNVSIPDCKWEKFNVEKMEREAFEGSRAVEGYIEDFIYKLLEAHHGGWEIDGGQNGEFEWDSETNEIVHHFQVMTYEHGSEEF